MDYKGKSIFLYMNFFIDDNAVGITKKIKAQIKTLRTMGLYVTYCAYKSDGAVIYDSEDKVIYEKKFKLKNAFINRYYRRFNLIDCVNDYIKNTNPKFDFAYLRWHTYDKHFLKMLKGLKNSGAACIVEAHAYTPNQVPTSLMAHYQLFMDKRYSRYAKKYVSLVAAISSFDNIWGIKTIQIDNAIDFSEISKRSPHEKVSCIRLLSVANERDYHGLDRLIKGISLYYEQGGQRDIEADFIGVYMNSTIKLVHELNLQNRISFVGKKNGSELDQFYDRADIGIGALAHHRIGMYEGSSLKTKEYFAKGLPFIYGWKEPAFDDTYPYAKRYSLCEDPINIDSLIAFYDSLENPEIVASSMREFALTKFSWEHEFSKIFSCI